MVRTKKNNIFPATGFTKLCSYMLPLDGSFACFTILIFCTYRWIEKLEKMLIGL